MLVHIPLAHGRKRVGARRDKRKQGNEMSQSVAMSAMIISMHAVNVVSISWTSRPPSILRSSGLVTWILSVVLAGQAEKMGHASAYSLDQLDDNFFSAQTMLGDRPESADEEVEEFDISLDDDLPETTSRTSAATGSAAAAT